MAGACVADADRVAFIDAIIQCLLPGKLTVVVQTPLRGLVLSCNRASCFAFCRDAGDVCRQFMV